MRELEVLKQIEKTSGKNDKLALLRLYDSPSLRTLLYLTYNSFLTYRVKALDFPSKYNTVQPDVTKQLEELLLTLAKHETGKNDAKALVKRLLSTCTENGAKWVARIIDRDLKIGIDVSTVNKAFPGLVPTFDVQLAEKLEDIEDLELPAIIEEKLDGMRVIAIVRDNKVTFYSRDGIEQEDRGVISKEILKLRPGTSFVLDGEVIAKKFNPASKVAMKNKDGNWPFEQGKSMYKSSKTTPAEEKEFLGYYVWDVLDLEYFETQGARGVKKPLVDRKCELVALFERSGQTYENLFMVPNVLCHTRAEIMEMFKVVRARGGEGLMGKKPNAPYEFKRSKAVRKLKEFYTADLRVVDAYEGKKGTKYEGMLGGVIVADDYGPVHADVGSGYSDLERAELWLRHLRGDLVGAIFEIQYFEITADNSLRFPTFIRERDDKNTTNME